MTMTNETLEQERHAVGRITRVFPEIVITEENKEGAAYLGVLPHHADYQSELRTQCRERQVIAEVAYNERLCKEVEDWTGMSHIAASRAEAADARVAVLEEEKTLREEHDRRGRMNCTTLEPLDKPLDEMTTEELSEVFEHSPKCGCRRCFLDGFTLRLKTSVDALRIVNHELLYALRIAQASSPCPLYRDAISHAEAIR